MINAIQNITKHNDLLIILFKFQVKYHILNILHTVCVSNKEEEQM